MTLKNKKRKDNKNSLKAKEAPAGKTGPVQENQHLISGESEIIEKVDEVEQLRAQLEEYKDLYLRKAAEFENFKKRKTQEFQTLIESAEESLINSLLPVLDDLDRFEHNSNSDNDSLLQGVQLIRDKLKNALIACGLEPIESIGKSFDPELHEAIMQQKDQNEEAGIVIAEHQRGYRLGGKVIRHAKVVVSS